LSSEVTLFSLSPSGTDTYHLNFVLDPAQQTTSVRPIAALDFLSLPTNHSIVVFVGAGPLTAQQSAATPAVTNAIAIGGRVFIIAREPVLDVTPTTPLTLMFYGFPGTNYILQSSTNPFTGWTQFSTLTPTNRAINIPVTNTSPAKFYRALQN
jgi:hypothetical protein